ALARRHDLQVAQVQRLAFGEQPQQTDGLVAGDDHQVLELRAAGAEARRVPGDAARCEVAGHVGAAEVFAEGEVVRGGGLEAERHLTWVVPCCWRSRSADTEPETSSSSTSESTSESRRMDRQALPILWRPRR